MLDSNKSTNFNKKSHFKVSVYVSYNAYDFTIRYDSYNTHTISYDSQALTIRRYDMKLFPHDTIRIAYRMILTTMVLSMTKIIFSHNFMMEKVFNVNSSLSKCI